MTKDELILKRDEEIADLKEQLSEALDKLDEFEENDVGIHLSDTEKSMLKIITEQIGQLAAISKVTKLDKDEAKLFDTYVKDLVAIRGKMPTKKSEKDKDVQQSEAEILKLINGE